MPKTVFMEPFVFTLLLLLAAGNITAIALLLMQRHSGKASPEMRELLEKQLRENRNELSRSIHDFRTEMMQALNNSARQMQDTLHQNLATIHELQKEKLEHMGKAQAELVVSTEKKLEEMRAMVEEKLQKTLNERIGLSFEIVRSQLENVQKGLGEMKSLAQDVGGLKKILGNVKTRGTFGEVQ